MARLIAVLMLFLLGCGQDGLLTPTDEKNADPVAKLVISNVAKGSRDRLTEQESIIYELAKKRVVNLVCYFDNNRMSFASGSFISSRGHILTAAHSVYKNNMDDCECDVRQGSPAKVIGRARIVFISEEYKRLVVEGKSAIRYDVAVLKMIPESYFREDVSFYKVDPDYRTTLNHEVMVFGYPGEYKSTDKLFNFLRMFQGLARINNLDYTYVTVNETRGAQKGSSGGILFDVVDSQFAGLIFGTARTSSDYDDPMERILFSLTAWALNSVIFNETQQHLSEFVENH